MGCSLAKLDSRKIRDSSILDVSDVQIQAVLQFSPEKRHSGKSGKSPSTKRHRRKGGALAKKPHSQKGRPESVTDKPQPAGTNKNNDPQIAFKYDVKALIGKGTYSRVHRVEHRTTKQPYALKTIEAKGGREAFEAELSVLRRFSHPNVIKLIEVFESPSGRLYMVMELATGGSLLDRLESKGPLGEGDARDALGMLLDGVRYLHSLGIAHRDLKPDNLLYYHPGKDSRIIISDFSFASSRKTSGNSFMHTVCGTPQYIAPEIVARKPYTCAVDMWASGVIMYIVLSGAFPFDDEHDATLFKMILKGEVTMDDAVWCNVSEEAKTLVHLLLCTSPSSRPSASTALLHPWFTTSKLTYTPPRSSAAPPPCSVRSGRSTGSSRSGGGSSGRLRTSGRVRPHHLDALSRDPEAALYMMAS